MTQAAPHERLDAYQLACHIARWARRVKLPRGDAALHDPLRRAADSVALNITEGAYRSGGDRRRHFRIAMGSAGEVAAVLDILTLLGGAEQQANCRRILAMVYRLR